MYRLHIQRRHGGPIDVEHLPRELSEPFGLLTGNIEQFAIGRIDLRAPQNRLEETLDVVDRIIDFMCKLRGEPAGYGEPLGADQLCLSLL